VRRRSTVPAGPSKEAGIFNRPVQRRDARMRIIQPSPFEGTPRRADRHLTVAGDLPVAVRGPSRTGWERGTMVVQGSLQSAAGYFSLDWGRPGLKQRIDHPGFCRNRGGSNPDQCAAGYFSLDWGRPGWKQRRDHPGLCRSTESIDNRRMHRCQPRCRPQGLPMASRCSSVRIKIRPWEMAGEAWTFSPRGFLARISKVGPAAMTVVWPSSDTK